MQNDNQIEILNFQKRNRPHVFKRFLVFQNTGKVSCENCCVPIEMREMKVFILWFAFDFFLEFVQNMLFSPLKYKHNPKWGGEAER